MKQQIKLVRGAGITSVQVMTDHLPGRPFPAYAVLCDIKDDGTILTYNGDKKQRANVIREISWGSSC